MNSLTVNLHLLMVSFYRPLGEPHADRRRGHDVPVGQLRRAQPGGLSRPRPRRGGRAPRHRRGHRPTSTVTATPSPSCCSAASTTSPASCSTSRRSPLPATPPGRSSAGTWPTPPATCRWRCTTGTSTSRPGARTSTSTPVPGRSPGRSSTSAISATPRCRASRVGGAPTRRRGSRWPPVARPPASADAWQVSNPPILAMSPVRTSLELFDKVGMPALRERSVRLTGYSGGAARRSSVQRSSSSRRAIRNDAAPSSRCASPAARRRIADRLRHEHGVIVDTRQPDIVRLAPVPLYSTYHDCWRAADALAEVLGRRSMSRTITTRSPSSVPGSPAACWPASSARRGAARDGVRAASRPTARARPSAGGRSTWRSPSAVSTPCAGSDLADQIMADALPMRGRMIHPVRRAARLPAVLARRRPGDQLDQPGGAQPRPARRRRGGAGRRRSVFDHQLVGLDPATRRDDVRDAERQGARRRRRRDRRRRRRLGGARSAARRRGPRRAPRLPRLRLQGAAHPARSTASSPSTRRPCTSGREARR